MGAEELWTREEFQTIVANDGIPKGMLPSKRRIWMLQAGVLTGVAAIIAGVALIFWPAALIVGGACAVAYCGWYAEVGISGPPKGEEE